MFAAQMVQSKLHAYKLFFQVCFEFLIPNKKQE